MSEFLLTPFIFISLLKLLVLVLFIYQQIIMIQRLLIGYYSVSNLMAANNKQSFEDWKKFVKQKTNW